MVIILGIVFIASILASSLYVQIPLYLLTIPERKSYYYEPFASVDVMSLAKNESYHSIGCIGEGCSFAYKEVEYTGNFTFMDLVVSYTLDDMTFLNGSLSQWRRSGLGSFLLLEFQTRSPTFCNESRPSSDANCPIFVLAVFTHEQSSPVYGYVVPRGAELLTWGYFYYSARDVQYLLSSHLTLYLVTFHG